MNAPLPQPPSNETSQVYDSNAVPHRVGSLLLQSVQVTVPTFTKELDLGAVANPQKHSVVKQYLFASLLFKPFISLFFDIFSLVFLSAWVKSSIGKVNSSGLVIYALATTGSLVIVVYGSWRASQVLRKGHIQPIFVNREAYRWICLRNREKFLFFERIGQGYGHMDALVFFTWFTLRDWIQHLLCDLTRLIINCTILAAVAHQQSLKERGEAPTLNLPELSGITHVAVALNIMLHVCNLIQFVGAAVVLVLVRMGKLISLRKDEQLHTYCQRNLNVRIVRMYKLAKAPGTKASLTANNHLEQQQMSQYAHATDSEGGIDLSIALAWDTETQDDHIDYNHYAYRPRPISTGPPARKKSTDDSERIEMAEKPQQNWRHSSFSSVSPPEPGTFSYAQWQHLQIQKQKYGDNKELYEPMQWSSPSTSTADNTQTQGYVSPPTQNQTQFQGQSQGQSQGQQQYQQQHQQQQQHMQTNDQYIPPPMGGGGQRASLQWAQQGRTPPIPPKNF
ncbi:hypothetical protein BGZ76_000467 [Entomortierella beljakovae]|nr:hypothetical protein BGZ76_000467 [Entomortierella beljakovae]